MLAHRLLVVVSRQVGALIRLQAQDLDGSAVLVVVRFRTSLSRYAKVSRCAQVVQIDPHPDFFRIAGATGPHFSNQPESGSSNIESHAKKAQIRQGIISGPARLNRTLKILE
jgi:hypothetical protein